MVKAIKNALVNGEITDILIDENGLIAGLGRYEGDGYDAGGRVTIPGFVDCHLHLDKSLLNEESPYQDLDGPGKGALTRERKKRFTVEDIKKRSEKIIRRAIASGTLVLRTNVDVDAIVGLKGIEALLGLKQKYRDLLEIQVVAFAQEGIFGDGITDRLLVEAVEMGADLIGGHTIAAGEGEKAIDFVLDIAKKYNLEADFHLDESGKPEHYLLPYLTKKMKELDLAGRVNAIHMCTLASISDAKLEQALCLAKQVKLKATIAPTAISTRAIAPVKKLLQAGIITGLGSDNVRDFFNPLGSGDIKQVALLLSYLQRFYTQEEVEQVFSMITSQGATLLGAKDFGIIQGGPANITILDAYSPLEVIAYGAQPLYQLRKGKEIKMGSF